MILPLFYEAMLAASTRKYRVMLKSALARLLAQIFSRSGPASTIHDVGVLKTGLTWAPRWSAVSDRFVWGNLTKVYEGLSTVYL